MTERIPTAAEIEVILSGVKPRSISPEAAASMEAGMKAQLAQALQKHTLTTGDMEQLKYAIDRHFQQALVTPGESVGVLAGQSMGEPSTQMSLSAHRTAGVSSKNSNEGIPRLQELLRATEQQRAISMSIHFWEKRSLAQLRELIPLFVQRELGSFIDRFDLERGDELAPARWRDRFRIINNLTGELPSHVLRLHLNVGELQRYRLSLAEVVEKLRPLGEELSYIYSSNELGLIEIYAKAPPFNETAAYITPENVLYFYLRDTVIPLVRKQLLTGIEGISDAFPTRIEYTSLISDWSGTRLSFNTKKGRPAGLQVSDLLPLLTAAGWTVASSTEEELLLTTPGSLKELTQLIKEQEALKELNAYWYLETNGSNLVKVLAMDIVNDEVSFCTDVVEIARVFGLWAARDYLLEEYTRVLSSDAYLDPRHLILLSDVMVNLGTLTAVTSTGASRQRTGPLTQSAFEKPVDHFMRAAAFGERETISGVSASIYVARKARIGPQAFLAPVAEEAVTLSVSTPKGPALPPSSVTLEEVSDDAPFPTPQPRREEIVIPKKALFAPRPSAPTRPAPVPVAPVAAPSIVTVEEVSEEEAPVSLLPKRRIGGGPINIGSVFGKL